MRQGPSPRERLQELVSSAVVPRTYSLPSWISWNGSFAASGSLIGNSLVSRKGTHMDVRAITAEIRTLCLTNSRSAGSFAALNSARTVYIERMKPGPFRMLRLRIAAGAVALTTMPVLAALMTPCALPAQQAALPERADSVLILKKDHVLELLHDGKAIRIYKVALGQGGLAPKQKEGDGRTPEGHYTIDARNSASEYHLSLHISYPSAEDRKRAASLGVAPGGAIMIHGLPNGKGWVGSAHRLYDWTLGCIAVTDPEIEEIWKLVPIGTPVEIRP